MQDLQLVGVHDEGEHVLLTGVDGQRYRLPIDEQLRAAVRRDRARLGQLQIEIQGDLRPRDIQARIRAGETAEDIALASGVLVEHVRRYEGPVLAEREHVAFRAQRQVVRSAGPGRGPELATLVGERLAARGVDGGAWDAWRRDDGTWTVQLTFHAGSKERRARWSYDLVSGALEPVEDEARWLCAAQTGESGPVPARRLTAVRERVYDVEADGGVREALDGSPPAGEPEGPDDSTDSSPASPDTADLLEELRGKRGKRQPVQTAQEMAGVDREQDPAAVHPPAAHPPSSRPHEATDAEILALPEPAHEAGSASAHQDDESPGGAGVDGEHATGHGTATKTRRHSAKSKGRRPSVPSWDEIVFGAKKE